MYLKIGKTINEEYYCCEIDEYNGEEYSFVYGKDYNEIFDKKIIQIEKRSKKCV